MLTLDDIILIYNAGFDIDIEDREAEDYLDDDPYILGHCYFGEARVILYTESIGDSIHELEKTAIHEFIHVRDYLRGIITDEFMSCKDEESKERFRVYERRVEEETELTYWKQPDIAHKIFECWGLNEYVKEAA
tara:strand:+ start:296 stop:697 length:402 start_codon:yes stop_codon:yes gene_type:complete